MIDQQLIARIDAIEPTTFAGQAFRHLSHDHHPLSGTGARIHGGRWNPPESFSTLYHLGLEGILAPSATGEGIVLAVFFDRLHADSQVRDLDHEPWIAPPPEPHPGH